MARFFLIFLGSCITFRRVVSQRRGLAPSGATGVSTSDIDAVVLSQSTDVDVNTPFDFVRSGAGGALVWPRTSGNTIGFSRFGCQAY